MPSRTYSIPIEYEVSRRHERLRYRIRVPFWVRNRKGEFRPMPCYLDTGAGHTCIPMSLADAQKIPYRKAKKNRVGVKTPIGESSAARPLYASPIAFALEPAPADELRFDSIGYFSPYDMGYALLSFSDVHEHFHIRTEPRPAAPFEALVLERRNRDLSNPPVTTR
jgi:hypothetical protein